MFLHLSSTWLFLNYYIKNKLVTYVAILPVSLLCYFYSEYFIPRLLYQWWRISMRFLDISFAFCSCGETIWNPDKFYLRAPHCRAVFYIVTAFPVIMRFLPFRVTVLMYPSCQNSTSLSIIKTYTVLSVQRINNLLTYHTSYISLYFDNQGVARVHLRKPN